MLQGASFSAILYGLTSVRATKTFVVAGGTPVFEDMLEGRTRETIDLTASWAETGTSSSYSDDRESKIASTTK